MKSKKFKPKTKDMAVFQVGQKAICIRNSVPYYTKGDIKEVQGIRKSICSCYPLLLDFGIAAGKYGDIHCPKCFATGPKTSVVWCNAAHWLPLNDMQTELSEVTEASVDEIINEPQTITI